MVTNVRPRVAVLLAAYNGVAWLSQQVESILLQQAVEVTLFVSVDTSIDGTEALADKMASEDVRVVVLPHGRRFGGAAPNFYRLLQEVDLRSFDYIALSDQDDVWLLNKLGRAVEVMAEDRLDAYSSDVTAFWPDGREQLITKSQPQVARDYLFEAAGPGCTYVLSRPLATEIQSFLIGRPEVNSVASHDWLIYAFTRAMGYRWGIDDFSGMLYRQHARNQVGANQGLRAFVSRARKVLSGWGFSQAYRVAKVVGMADDPFVVAWSSGTRLGYLRLALRAGTCRRRFRDRVYFCLACVLLAIVRPAIKTD